MAIVTESFLPRTDGVVRTLLELLRYLRLHNHEALVLAAGPGPTEHEGYPVARFGGLPFPPYPDLTISLFGTGMARLLRAWAPDVLHLASPFALGMRGCRAGRLLGVPVAAHYMTDVPRYARYFGLGACVGLARWHVTRLHNACQITYAPTESTRRELLAQGIAPVRVLGRGVDTALFTPVRRSDAVRRILLRADEDLLILYVGRLSTEKNLGYLGPLIAQIPRARLVLVGDGPHRAALESRFRALPVSFLGQRHGADLAALYASADLFAFPSLTETFGQVVQEAMASGLPVLAFRAGGIQDLLRDGQEGYLCTPEDYRDWYASARRLAANSVLRARLGERARAAVAGRTWEAIFARLLDDYAELARLQEPRDTATLAMLPDVYRR
ncbi:MAG TPA: glycosyltransferase family 1 protein [Chloroflexota bacterium]|nr:glycosyltransferase family 1 protein [Chloroflexota bacterium]